MRVLLSLSLLLSPLTALGGDHRFTVTRVEAFSVQKANPLPAGWEEYWPASVRVPRNLRPFRKTDYGQYIVIMNGQDYHSVAHKHAGHSVGYASGDGDNGNGRFPWAVPGGTDNVRGLTSLTGIALPEGKAVRYWTERVEAGASRPLPKVTWSFPVGTRVYDLLAHNGKAFELRMLRKEERQWKALTLWESGDWPPGYQGTKATGRSCIDCHSRAGKWEQYGPLIRGNDFVFGWTAFREGATEIDRSRFPVKHWDEP